MATSILIAHESAQMAKAATVDKLGSGPDLRGLLE